MAVAFNNTNTMAHVSAASFSGSMNVTAGGSNIVAFAAIGFDFLASESITGVTYGGSSMTSCGAASTNATSNSHTQGFYLINPPTGSNTLAVTGNANVAELYVNLISFTGVDQTTPVRPGTYATSSGNSTSPSLVISSNANDLTLSIVNAGPVSLSSTNQTSDGISTAGNNAAGSDHATTAAASVTHTWTQVSGQWAIAGFSIQAVSIGGFTAKFKSTLSPIGTKVGSRQIHDYSH